MNLEGGLAFKQGDRRELSVSPQGTMSAAILSGQIAAGSDPSLVLVEQHSVVGFESSA
jgi:hypothetical protein